MPSTNASGNINDHLHCLVFFPVDEMIGFFIVIKRDKGTNKQVKNQIKNKKTVQRRKNEKKFGTFIFILYLCAEYATRTYNH